MSSTERQVRDDMLRAAHAWRFRLEDPDATDEDRQAFEAWRRADPRHGDLYDHAVTFHQALGTLTRQDLEDDVIRPTFRERLAHLLWRRSPGASPNRAGVPWLAATMALIVACSALFLAAPWGGNNLNDAVILETGLGETQRFTLGDGTVVTLSAASIVETTYTQERRTALLREGAAFFEVAREPDRAFFVKAGDLQVRVLGTVFDVAQASDMTRVAVAEGEVEVSYPSLLAPEGSQFRTTQTLTPGQQVAASPGGGLESVRPIAAAAIGAWRNDRLFYDGARLAELVADANRYSDTRVVIEGDIDTIANYQVRGSFNARDVDGMLLTLPEIYPVEIDRSRAGVIRIIERQP